MDAATIPATSGIYRIVCTVTGKIYIGSAFNLQSRWRRHRSDLLRNIHPNPKLQASFNKHGLDMFCFEILEYVLPISLTAREQYWFNKLKPAFNLLPVAGSRLGSQHSDATREKIGRAGRGRAFTQEHRIRISTSNRGNPKRMGKKASPSTRAKMSAARHGVPQGKHSPETLAKINARAAKRMITLILTCPSGEEQRVTGIKQFCREHQLDRSALMQVAQGKAKQHKGWSAHYP